MARNAEVGIDLELADIGQLVSMVIENLDPVASIDAYKLDLVFFAQTIAKHDNSISG